MIGASDEVPEEVNNTINSDSPNRESNENIWAKIPFLEHPKEYPGQQDNFIRTTRYTLLTFIPLTLLENYRVLTNVYFLIVLIISLFPLSPVHYMFTLIPMIIVLLISMVRAGIEDYMKYRQDKERNNAPVKIYRFGEWIDSISKDIQTGDVIMIHAHSQVPCDLLYLTSSKPNQSANFSSADLNGEAAIQTITVHPAFKGQTFPQYITKKHFTAELTEPDRDLYKFDARLTSGDEFWPITIRNMLLRGTVIEYTDWVIGVALRTGHDCKIMKNQRHPPAKMTQFDKDINTMVLIIFVIDMVFVFLTAGLCCYYEQNNNFHVLDSAMPSAGTSFFEAFLQWFVLFSYLIPLSLMATIEVCRLFLMGIMAYDKYMVEEDRGKASPHNSNMIGQLGLVTHVLSDKTGTLTENVMHLNKFTDEIGTYETDAFIKMAQNEPEYVTKSKTFIEALALCNTVIVFDNQGTLEYNAESPDESAFVQFAADVGVKLIEREPEYILIENQGQKQKYNILSLLPFNSDRKRMSIVIQREGEENAIVFTKGADSVMYQRCNEIKYNEDVNTFSCEGLRTLVFGMRALTKQELEEWLKEYNEANAAITDREKKLDEISSSIESNLDIIGVSAVEDRLQPSVPEAVLWLRRAGIAFWVLTGDKLETAIEIGKTTSVILPNADTLILSSSNDAETLRMAENYTREFDNFKDPVLVLTEKPTELLLNTEDENIISLAKRCKSVIFARSTPFMKAKVVSLVKKFKGSLTLAIGDGANDVGMIQESHVGVGISGLEGNQAAMCSDFAIPRFRHLIRLIAVHGHWSNDRFNTVAMIMIYKNIVFSFVMMWMACDTLFSPSSYFNSFFMSCFNLLFTLIPPFAYGWLEQDIVEAQLVKYPQLHREASNPMVPPGIIYYTLLALYQSVIIYYINRVVMPEAGFTENGFFTFLGVVLVVSIQVDCWIKYWNWVTFLANFGTIALAVIVMVVYGGFFEYWEIMPAVLYYMKETRVYGMLLATVIIALFPSVVGEYFYDTIHPKLSRLLREREKLDRDGPIDFAEAMKMNTDVENLIAETTQL